MIRCDEGRDGGGFEINMAPMVDMIFLLLIFFLTATTFAEREREQPAAVDRDPFRVAAAVAPHEAHDARAVELTRDLGAEDRG